MWACVVRLALVPLFGFPLAPKGLHQLFRKLRGDRCIAGNGQVLLHPGLTGVGVNAVYRQVHIVKDHKTAARAVPALLAGKR